MAVAALLLGALAVRAKHVGRVVDGDVVVRAGEARAHGLAALLDAALAAAALDVPGVLDGRVVVRARGLVARGGLCKRGVVDGRG